MRELDINNLPNSSGLELNLPPLEEIAASLQSPNKPMIINRDVEKKQEILNKLKGSEAEAFQTAMQDGVFEDKYGNILNTDELLKSSGFKNRGGVFDGKLLAYSENRPGEQENIKSVFKNKPGDDISGLYPSYNEELGKYILKATEPGFPAIEEARKVGKNIIDFYGNPIYSDNPLVAFGKGLSKSTATLIPNMVNMTNAVYDVVDKLAGGFEGTKFERDKEDWIHNFNDYWQAMGTQAYQSSQKVEQDPYSFEGSSEVLGSGIGSILQYMTTAAATKGALTVGGKALGKQLTEKAALRIAMGSSGMLLNGGEAYSQSLEAGLSPEDRGTFALAVGGINSAIEMGFGANVLTKYLVLGRGAKEIPEAIIKETGGDMSKIALDKATPKIMKKITKAITNFTKIPILGTGMEEGFEEIAQSMAMSTSEIFYDKVFADQTALVGEGKFGTRFNNNTLKQSLQEGYAGALTGMIMGIPGAVSETRNKGKKIIDDNIIDRYISTGHEQFVKDQAKNLLVQEILTPEQHDNFIKRIDYLAGLREENKALFQGFIQSPNKDVLIGQALKVLDKNDQLIKSGGLNSKEDINSDFVRQIIDNKYVGSYNKFLSDLEENKNYKTKELAELVSNTYESLSNEYRKDFDELMMPVYITAEMDKRVIAENYSKIQGETGSSASKLNNFISSDKRIKNSEGIQELIDSELTTVSNGIKLEQTKEQLKSTKGYEKLVLENIKNKLENNITELNKQKVGLTKKSIPKTIQKSAEFNDYSKKKLDELEVSNEILITEAVDEVNNSSKNRELLYKELSNKAKVKKKEVIQEEVSKANTAQQVVDTEQTLQEEIQEEEPTEDSGGNSINALFNQTVNTEADKQEEGQPEYKNIGDVLNKKYKDAPHALKRDIDRLIKGFNNGKLTSGVDAAEGSFISQIVIDRLKKGYTIDNVRGGLKMFFTPQTEDTKKIAKNVLDLLNEGAVNSKVKEEQEDKKAHRQINEEVSSQVPTIKTAGITIGPVDKRASQRIALKNERDEKLNATTDLTEKAKIVDMYGRLLAATPARYHLRDNTKGLNFSGSTKLKATDKRNEILLITSEHQEMINKGIVKVDDIIHFEVDKNDEFESEKAQYRKFFMVVYKGTQRIVVGAVPIAGKLGKEVDASVTKLREQLHTIVNNKYNTSGQIVSTGIQSIVAGANYEFSQSEEIGTPIQKISDKDQKVNEVKNIGGYMVTFIESEGFASPDTNLPIEINEHFGNSRTGDLIVPVPHPIKEGEWLYLEAFRRSLGQVADSSQEGLDKYNSLKGYLLPKFIEYALSDEGTKPWVDLGVFLDNSKIKTTKTHLILLNRGGKEFANIPRVEVEEQTADKNSQLNQWLNDQYLRTNKKLYNTTKPSEGHNLGVKSYKETYNQLIAPFIGLNTVTGRYLKNTDIISKTVEDYNYNSSDKGKSEPTEKSRPNSPAITEYENEADPAQEETLKEIEKYEAELKKTGKSKKEDVDKRQTPKGDKDIGSGRKIKGSLRRDKDEGKPRAKDNLNTPKWSQKQEIEWFNKNFKNVPLEVLENLKEIVANGSEYWGVFKNAAIYIEENAASGTLYHEAYHTVFNLFTTPVQRARLLKESSKRYNINKDKYTSIEDYALALEEEMADDFMEVIQSEEVPKSLMQKLGKYITDFFRYIQSFIKSIQSNPTFGINEFMWRANNGFYKNAKIQPGSFGTNVQRNKPKGWTNEHTTEATNVINGYLINNVIPSYRDIEGYEDMTTLEIINEIGIDDLYRDVIQELRRLRSEVNEEIKGNINELLNNLYNFETDEFLELRTDLLRGLINYNVKIKPNENTTASSTEKYNAEDSNEDLLKDAEELAIDKKENWMNHATEISSKDTAPIRIKEFIRNMYIPNKDNRFGLEAHVNYEDTYNTLLKTLAGSTRVEDIVKMLEFEIKATDEHPEYQQILDEFEKDSNFKAQFFQAFNNNHTKYIMVSYIDGNYAVYEANRAGLTNTIINGWREYILRSSIITMDKQGNPEVNDSAKEIVIEIKEEINNVRKNWNEGITEDFYKPLSDSFAKLGIDIKPKVFKYIGTSIEGSTGKSRLIKALIAGNNNFKFVLDKFENNINPFEGGLSKGESEAIKNMARWVSKASPDMYESSFRKIDGKTAYAHLEQSFITKLVHDFKNSDRKESILLKYGKDQLFAEPIKNEDGEETIFHNRILEDLANDKDTLDIYVTEGLTDDQFNRTAYEKLDKTGLSLFTIHNYFNNGRKEDAIYRATVLSDAPNGLLFKHRKENDIDKILNHLTTIANAEHDRILDISEAHKLYEEGKLDSKDLIENYHIKEGQLIRGNASINGYHIIQALRGKNYTFNTPNSKKAAKSAIDKWLKEETKKYWDSLIKSKLIVVKDDKISTESRISEAIITKYPTKIELMEFIKEFYYNDFLARIEFSLLSIGDPTFYKAGEGNNKTIDYVKRAKEIYSPKTILDISNPYTDPETGEVINVGKTYKTIYLSDNEIESPSYTAMSNALDSLVSENIMTAQEAKEIKVSYGYNNKKKKGNINQTDAQAYITLPFYRKTMIGMGRWTNKHQRVYKRLIKGEGIGEDISLMMQPLKPFAYGLVYSDKYKRLIPVQNKNSEYLLLPQLVKGNTKLENLYNYLETNNIDSANFNSAVKAGLSRVVDSNLLDNPIELEVSEWTHNLNMEDRGIQQEVPEHFVDANNLFGSQIRKLIMSDLVEGTDYFNGMKAKELLKMYEDLIIADLQESYEQIANEFVTEWDENGIPKSIDYKYVYNIMLEEAYNRGKGEEFEKAIEYDGKRNRLTLPLFNPVTSNSAQNIITSIFKSRITKQKIKGGSFVQLSNFGMSDELKLVYFEEGSNKSGLKHAEIMLPAFSKEFFKDFMNGNGDIDFNAINEHAPEIMEMLGYRIPTEDKYSMLPMKVVGFLPYSAGGAVMLPSDITTISGSDFDVDKMYIMMKAFTRSKDGKYEVTKYDDSKTALENTKEARDNRKIDIMLSILQNPNTLKAILSGGTFKPLQTISKATQDVVGKDARHLDPMSLMSMDQTQIDNMTGKSMVGIAANENSFHALAQHANFLLPSPVKFDDLNLRSLSGTQAKLYVYINEDDKTDIKVITEKINQKISKNKAYYLAAIVDNAKDPLAAYINYNDFTSGIVGLLTQVGLDPAAVTWFLKQPILVEFTQRYYESGGNLSEETKLIEEYKKKLGIKKDLKESPSLYTKELYNNLNKPNTDYQKTVFEAFIIYREMAKNWTALILASRADVKGIGPTIADAEVILRAKQKVLEDDFGILGVKEFFNLESNGTRLVAASTLYGVEKPNDVISLMFPYNKGFFKQVKDYISENIKGRELSVKEINSINSQVTVYLLSQYDLFNPNDRSYFVNEFPKIFLDFKEKNTILANNDLIKRLDYASVKSDPKIPVERIIFNNTGSLTPELKNSIQKSWSDLYESEEYRDMAIELLKYTYFTTGLAFGINGFSHLLPTDVMTDNGVKDSNDKSISEALYNINDNIKNIPNYDIFIDQFYKNSYKNKTFVPSVNEDFSNIAEKRKNDKGKIIGFTIDSKVTDKSFMLKKPTKTSPAKFVPFISYSVKGKSKQDSKIGLFKLDESNNTYNIVNKLGVPNFIYEYLIDHIDYNTSVINSNNIVQSTSPLSSFDSVIEGEKVKRTFEAPNDVSNERFKINNTTEHISHKLNKDGTYTIKMETSVGNIYEILRTKDNKYVHIKDVGDSVSPPLQIFYDKALAKINKLKGC